MASVTVRRAANANAKIFRPCACFDYKGIIARRGNNLTHRYFDSHGNAWVRSTVVIVHVVDVHYDRILIRLMTVEYVVIASDTATYGLGLFSCVIGIMPRFLVAP